MIGQHCTEHLHIIPYMVPTTTQPGKLLPFLWARRQEPSYQVAELGFESYCSALEGQLPFRSVFTFFIPSTLGSLMF